MDNNQNNFNNPQLNNNMGITNPNDYINNQQQNLNVIPNNNNSAHQFDEAFINKNVVNNSQNSFINQNSMNITNGGFNPTNPNELEDTLTIQHQNKFINNNINTGNTSLNNLNVDGAYNNMPKVDYSQDPKVKENLQKKNTVTITGEGKVFLIIVVVLLIFIFVLPTIFDLIANVKYS